MSENSPSPLRRRSFLKTGAAGLATAIAGCTTTQQGEPTETEHPYGFVHPDPPAYFRSVSSPTDESFTFDDLPFKRHARINNHPDTRNIQLNLETSPATVVLKNIAITRPLELQIFVTRPYDLTPQWYREELPTLSIPADNSAETDQLEYTTRTLEIPTPTIPPHLHHKIELVLTDPARKYNPTRHLKVHHLYNIPYGINDSSKTRIFDGPGLNDDSNYTPNSQPKNPLRNKIYTEQLDNGDTAAFTIINDTYGLGTTLSQAHTNSQWTVVPGGWPALIRTNVDARNWPHVQALAASIETVHSQLGRPDTLKSRIQNLRNFLHPLQYARVGNGTYTHPSTFLGLPDMNCSQKTCIAMGLLQHEPFNLRGTDAAYIYAKNSVNAHLLAGINTDLFDDPEPGWEKYRLRERVDGPDETYYPFDPTQNYIGRVDPVYPEAYPVSDMEFRYNQW